MRQIRTILTHRLTHNLSLEQTALAVRRSKGSVFNICNRFTTSGLTWPLDPELTDGQLEVALFPPSSHPETASGKTPPLPDIGYIEKELARKHVTVALLYEEYRRKHPDGISQASFCRYIHSHKKPNLSLHHVYKGGDILYSDYSGDGLEYIDIETGECIAVELFVTALAASCKIYAEVTLSQHTHHFTMAHVHAFEYYGGVRPALCRITSKVLLRRQTATIQPLTTCSRSSPHITGRPYFPHAYGHLATRAVLKAQY